MADEKFRLPKSSYEEVAKIIKGYSQFDGPIGLVEIGKQIGVHPTIVSKNVGFLLDIVVLEGGRDKQCTPKGRKLAQALIHEMPEEIRRLWRSVVSDSEFLSRIVGAVRIRQGMDDSTIQSHIAYSAGQPKNSGVMTGTRTVVDILRAAELIREENGKYIAVEVDDSETEILSEHIEEIPTGLRLSGRTGYVETPGSSAAVTVRINVNIQCAPDDVQNLGAQLRQLMTDLSSEDDKLMNSDES